MPTPTELRDQAAALAAEEPAAAARLAQRIPDPWFKAQALGHAVRYADSDHEAAEWAQEAVSAAADDGDAYRQVVPCAWPIRALLERGQGELAMEILEVVTTAVPRIVPPSSRAEALLQLLHAAFATSTEIRRSMVFALRELADQDDHWRVQRALQEALALLHPIDPEFAVKLGMQPQADGSYAMQTPRAYFW